MSLDWLEGKPGERPPLQLPAAYAWLAGLQLPGTLREALPFLGIREFDGKPSNPILMRWAAEVGLKKTYSNDEIPWCGLFVAVMAKRAGWPVVEGPLWARNWAKFGNPSPEPGLGDVLVFERGSGGHVGLYVGEDATHLHVCGGNQSNAVTIARLAKNRLLAARRPAWRVAQPASVKPYRVASTGAPVSTNEA